MRCDELHQLMIAYSRKQDKAIAFQLIATHARSCSLCARGLSHLAQALLSFDTLTCEECRTRLPNYYEATHPDHPQVSLPDTIIAAVAVHLGACPACHKLYTELFERAEMEEMGL